MHIILLDQVAVHQESPSGLVFHWAKRDVAANEQSLPLLVDQQAATLRQEYLAWVHELGLFCVHGRTVRESLDLGYGPSFWWLSLIAEKSPLKTPWIFDVLKLRALEQRAHALGCKRLTLYSQNKRLHRILSHWCQQQGIVYRQVVEGGPAWPPTKKRWFKRLPHAVQAVGYLVRFIWKRWRHVSKVQAIPLSGRQATLVSHFPNIDREAANQGRYRSIYWQGLHEKVLDKGPWNINWIWLHVDDGHFSFEESIALRNRFQSQEGNRERYYFYEEFLSPIGLLRAVRLYLTLAWRGLTLGRVKMQFCLPQSQINFWPILKDDWLSSLYGFVAMDNCLSTCAFDALTDLLGKQEWCLYHWENQVWERSLLWWWKKRHESRIIGYQPGSTPYMAFNNLEDPRSYGSEPHPPLLPDQLAVNGSASRDTLKFSAELEKRMVDAEALRYLYLSRNDDDGTHHRPPAHSTQGTLLVLLASSIIGAEEMLRVLDQAFSRGALDGYQAIKIKRHPDTPIRAGIRGLTIFQKAEEVDIPLSQLWSTSSVVFSDNYTSAGMEAVWNGLPLIVFVGNDGLNLSPLSGIKNVLFVTSVDDLCRAIANHPGVSSTPDDLLFIDNGLPRWRKIFGYREASI